MSAPSPPSDVVQFGVFQLGLKARELHKAGVKIKLQEQPFRVLVLLVERAGEIVTREELRQKVWPTDVYVAFDQGLNNAIRKVRDALGDSADSPRFIETLARHGYRFIAPVTLPSPAPAPLRHAPASQPPASSHAPWKIALIGLIAAGLLATVTYWVSHGSALRTKPISGKVILAVLPFDNLSRDPDQEFFSEGLTEELTTQLGKLNPEQLVVIARSSVARYKGSNLTAEQIGGELHADYLVHGSVRRVPGRVHITVQLIQAQDQTNLWAESYDREMKDILLVQDSVTRSIADQIHITLTPGQRTQLATRPLNPEAYEAYLKGRFYWNKRTAQGLQKAIAYFQEAIDKDPAEAAAYSGFADCNSGLAWHGFESPAEALPVARAAAQKAIEVDPQSAEAHASLGLVFLHLWNWPGAEAEFKRALLLDPHYANAHHWYGDYLSIQGRHDEALVEARQALDLDPLNLMIGTWVGLRYYLARQYDLAIKQAQSTVDLEPGFGAAHLVLGQAYVQAGLRDRGLAEVRSGASLSGGSPLYLAQVGVAQAVAGRKAEALQVVAQLQALSAKRYVSPYGLAQIYAALNDREQALKWLQAAYEDHAVWMCYLAVDPVFDGLRSDPRFQDLLRLVRGSKSLSNSGPTGS